MGKQKNKVRSEMMTLKQIAEHFGKHRQTIGRLVKSGDIPAMRVGGEWRFDLNKVEEAFYQRAEKRQ